MKKETTKELQTILQQVDTLPELKIFLQAEKVKLPWKTFSEYFSSLPQVAALEKSDLIRKSGLERTYAYQILNGTRANPGRDKILRLCLAAGLSLKETQRGLELSEEAPLYPRNRRDAIIIFAVNKGLSVMDTIELLDSFQEPSLS